MVLIHKKNIETEEEKQQKAKEASLGIQDEFQAKGFELVSFAQAHKGSIIGVIVLFFVIGALVTAYFYRQKRIDEEASNALIEALAVLEEENETESDEDKKKKNIETIEKLKNIETNYKGSKVSIIASMYISNLSLMEGQSKEGVEHYQAAVKRLNQNDNLYPIALVGLGYAFLSNNQPKEALETFEKVIALKKGLAEDVALWESARLLNEANEHEKAKTYLTRLIEEHPSSSFKKNAESLKATIK